MKARHRSAAIRNQLLIAYAPLVRRVVHALPFTFMGCADEDDMIGEGIFGLMDAIDKYDARRNVKFETYASLRIRGAVLDKLRKMDVLSRGTRERVRQIEEICDTLEKSLMRHPTHAEIAQAAGLTEQAVRKALEEAALSSMISLEDVLAGCGPQEDARTETPEQILERSELTDTLTRAIEDLRDNESRSSALTTTRSSRCARSAPCWACRNREPPSFWSPHLENSDKKSRDIAHGVIKPGAPYADIGFERM